MSFGLRFPSLWECLQPQLATQGNFQAKIHVKSVLLNWVPGHGDVKLLAGALDLRLGGEPLRVRLSEHHRHRRHAANDLLQDVHLYGLVSVEHELMVGFEFYHKNLKFMTNYYIKE